MDLREVTEFFRDFAGYIITIGVILFVFVFIVAIQPVAGNSMHPTLEDTELTLVSRFAYKISKPKRNEIVILKKDKKSYVKRIIGLPGEKVEYLKNKLYINDEPFKELFLEEGIVTSGFTLDDICKENECPDGVIPKDKYLVLGDNRPESDDSRNKSFGLVDKSELKGKVFFRIWPLGKFGKVN